MIFFLPLLSSLLIVLSLLVPHGGYLIFIALVPLFWFAKFARQQEFSNKKIWLFIWLSGFVFFLVYLSWMLQIKINLAEPVKQSVLNVILTLSWLSASLIFSIGYAFFAAIYIRNKKILNSPLLTLTLLPAAWVLGEYLRSWLYGLYQWAPDATLGPHWNFGALGYGAITTPLAPISRIVGLFGLGAVIVMINLVVFFVLSRKYRALWAILPIFSFWLIGSYGFPNHNAKTISVTAVQLAANQTISSPIAAQATQNSLRRNYPVDLVVLPEYAMLYEGNQEEKLSRVFVDSTLPKSAEIIYSTHNYLNGDTANRTTDIVFADNKGRALHTEKKQFLIPGGEYLPEYSGLLFKVLGHPELQAQHQQYRYIKKASYKEAPYNKDGLVVGALSCSGIVSTELYRNLANKGAQILTNSASLESFTNVSTYFKQAKQMAIFQAVANAKPFVQASRAGRSYVIDANGITKAETSQPDTEVLNTKVTVSSTRTFFTKFGDITVPLAAIVIIWFLVFKQPRHKP